jgi:hypothetical protein
LNHPPEIFLFVGRLHPLLVHLPIGMIALLAMLELTARIPRFKNAGASAGFILAFAMPPASQPQPTADDLALLRWWIDAGAPKIKTVAELKLPENILKIIAARFDISAALP